MAPRRPGLCFPKRHGRHVRWCLYRPNLSLDTGCGNSQLPVDGRHRGLPALVPLTWCPQLPIVAVAPFCHWKSRMKFFARYCDTTCRLGFIFQRQHYEYLEPGTATCCHISMSRSAPYFFLTQLFESSRFTSSSRHSGYQVTAQMQMRRHIIFAPQQDQHGDFSAE